MADILGISLGPKFTNMKHRLAHRVQTENAVQEAISKLDSTEVSAKLGNAVPCAPVRSIDEIYQDNELFRTGVLKDIICQSGMKKRTDRIATSPIFRKVAAHKRGNPIVTPRPGEHNNVILKSLGYSNQEIGDFRWAGIL